MAYRHYFFALAVTICSAAAIAAEPDEKVLPSSIEPETQGLLSWSSLVDSLSEEMQSGTKLRVDADALYLELHEVWLQRQQQLQEVLGRVRSPSDPLRIPSEKPAEETIATLDATPVQQFETVRDLYEDLVDLYQVRLRLLELVTPNLHAEITGLDQYGVQELNAEMGFVIQVIRFQSLGSEFTQRLHTAPFLLVWQLLQAIAAVLIFGWWRSWLPITLSRIRSAMMEIRPRGPVVVRRLKLLWYIEKARSPIEWLILFLVVSSVFDIEGLRFEEDLIRIIVRWVFIGWFAISLINANLAREQPGQAGGLAKIRQKSFHLLTVWLMFLGLGLQLTEILAGTAAIYAWVWLLFEMFSVPLVIVILMLWRPEIFRRLKIHPERTKIIEQRLKYQTGLRSILYAIYGVAFLFASWLRRFLLRQVSRLGTTRILDTGTTYDSGTRDSSNKKDKRLPIDENIREQFLTLTKPYQKYMRSELRALKARAMDQRGGAITLIGERGIGKSALLHRLASELKDQMLILECGSGGYPELAHKLSLAIDCGSGPLDSEKISKKLEDKDIRVVALDNGHYLIRPVMGGHQELEGMVDFVKTISSKIMWLTTFDRYSAQLALRVRAGKLMVDEFLDMPPWTHEQLGELIDQRCEEAGIEPDFENLAIPSEYLETTHETTRDRNRAAVYRMLSNISDGNPAVAMQCWLDCLHLDSESNRLVVNPPSRRTDRGLVAAAPDHEMLLILRVLAQSELTSMEDIAENLGFTSKTVTAKLYMAKMRGWVEEVEDRYRLSWVWFRSITQALVRRNLLSR